ncbi:prolactin receptor-like isoform X1 [Anguilla anguilla]|uniref:prolactin receptor-like isoform X1 n=1 Tax=Anguilla anguilla TaxID=7936 RepID=UPI0015AED1BD|nr:prolactin receptor-like isoform X1 [Anguilla anguilla]
MLWSLFLFALVVEVTSHGRNTTRSPERTTERATLQIWGASHRREQDNPSLLLRPQIHYCRSPNMETFTCWWHFPDNGSRGNENITYTLTYSVGNGPKKECPDYVTGGANSCYFDSRHTQVWEIYCMSVVAHGRHGNYTSEDHCLDVADIVETDPPFNLTYWLTNSSEEGAGRSAMVSWLYPNAEDVHSGWVTLVFELQYRRQSEPHNWKVKGVLREPRLELLDLPPGSYVVRVRCKSHISKLWSKWSELLTIHIPNQQSIGMQPENKMLAIILVTGIGVMAFLMIGFGVIPHSKRIKAFLLPPVPKPRIRGIDPILLKNGRMDEITRLFKSFHGYSPPQYCAESWLHVTTDEGQSLKGSPLAKVSEKVGQFAPDGQPAAIPADQQVQQGSSPYCEVPPQAPVESSAWPWPCADPRGYAVAPGPAQAMDFYTCVNGVNTSGAVQLVPCRPAHVGATPLTQLKEGAEKGGAEERGQLVMDKAQQRALAEDVTPVSTGGTAGPPGGQVGGCYTTMEDLKHLRDRPVDVAAAQGDGQEEALCSEQSQIPAPSLPAVTEGAEP